MKFDIRLFIFQLINFLIFWAVIHFALVKILKVIKTRNQQIADDLQKAKEEREEAFKIRKEWDEKIKTAEAEANKIIETTKKEALDIRREETEKTKKEIEQMITLAKQEIEKSKKEVVKKIQGEIAEIAGNIALRFIKEKIDVKRADEMVDEMIKEQEGIR
ncbi:MAG: F0F1 ATP synthase subunit B [Candidatus Hydrogenedentota bacterium]